MAMMPALTIQQPWAAGIYHGFKEYETRNWKPTEQQLRPGQWLAIHAASYGNPPAAELNRRLNLPNVRRTLGAIGITADTRVHANLPMGEVIAIAKIGGFFECEAMGNISDIESEYGDWTQKWAWRLTEVIKLGRGVSCPGRQGLFRLQPNVTLLVASTLIAEGKIKIVQKVQGEGGLLPA